MVVSSLSFYENFISVQDTAYSIGFCMFISLISFDFVQIGEGFSTTVELVRNLTTALRGF